MCVDDDDLLGADDLSSGHHQSYGRGAIWIFWVGRDLSLELPEQHQCVVSHICQSVGPQIKI